MHRFTLVPMMFASLMVLSGAAQAQDKCDDPNLGLFPAEVSMCQAYCTHMDCDNINDGDPLSSPQASQNACGNVAVSLIAIVEGIARRDVDPVEAMSTLDDVYCPELCPDGSLPPCV